MRAFVVAVGIIAIAAGCGGGGDGVIVKGDRGPRTDYYGVDVADMNGDGFNDIVAAGFTFVNEGDRSWYVSVFIQSAVTPGSFAAPVKFDYAVPEISPLEISLVDLQGDGLPDVVASGFSEGGFRVLLNDPANPGTLLASTHYGPPGAPARWPRLEVIDIDGDAFLDVLIADDTTLSYYRQSNMQPGTFLGSTPIGAGFQVSAAADINGDGVTDAVTFGTTGQYDVPDRLLYYRQSLIVPGQFLQPVPHDFDFSGQDIGVADLNNDNRIDIAVSGFTTDPGTGMLDIYHQDVNGMFQLAQSIETSSDIDGSRLTPDDLDADGDIEIVIGQRNAAKDPNTVEIFSQRPDGSYFSYAVLTVPDDLATTVQEMFSVRCADLNNDGLTDIAVSTHELFVFFALPGQPGRYGSATRLTVQR